MVIYESYAQGIYGPVMAVEQFAKIKSKNTLAKTHGEALQELLPAGLCESGFVIDENSQWQERVLVNIPGLWAKRYINPEESLFLLTGSIVNHAVYRFECNGENVFTMRPDYGRLCILTNLSEAPINSYEEKIREKMIHHREKIAAIYYGIKHGEIQNLVPSGKDMEAPLEDWTAFFQSRNFDLSHIPSEYLVDKFSRLMAEIDSLVQSLSLANNYIEQIGKNVCSEYPRELMIAIRVFEEFWKDRPQDMNPASAQTVENFIMRHMSGKVDKAALKRISTVAKPEHERAGGAPSSERRTFKGHSAENKKNHQ